MPIPHGFFHGLIDRSKPLRTYTQRNGSDPLFGQTEVRSDLLAGVIGNRDDLLRPERSTPPQFVFQALEPVSDPLGVRERDRIKDRRHHRRSTQTRDQMVGGMDDINPRAERAAHPAKVHPLQRGGQGLPRKRSKGHRRCRALPEARRSIEQIRLQLR